MKVKQNQIIKDSQVKLFLDMGRIKLVTIGLVNLFSVAGPKLLRKLEANLICLDVI